MSDGAREDGARGHTRTSDAAYRLHGPLVHRTRALHHPPEQLTATGVSRGLVAQQQQQQQQRGPRTSLPSMSNFSGSGGHAGKVETGISVRPTFSRSPTLDAPVPLRAQYSLYHTLPRAVSDRSAPNCA